MKEAFKEKIVRKIITNKFIKLLYAQYEDFEHGRAFFGKITSLSAEFNLAILTATFIFGIDLKQHIPEAITITIFIMLAVYMFGKFYRRSRLLEVELRVSAERNPLGDIHLRASEAILKEFGDRNDEK